MGRKSINEIGEKYSRLLVIGAAGKNQQGTLWKCICDCGKNIVVLGHSLRSGNTKSCGCLQRDRTHEVHALPEGQAAFNRVYDRYKRDAKRRGYSWTLSKEDVSFLTKMNCHYCNSEPVQKLYHPKYNGCYIYTGIDRIDNTKGYTMDNVVPCCKVCNRMKDVLSYKEFLDHISRIIKHRGTKCLE